MTEKLTNLLTPHRRVFLKVLMIAQVVKEFLDC